MKVGFSSKMREMFLFFFFLTTNMIAVTSSANQQWSALYPIGCSPFLLSLNLQEVEQFSAFISHLDDISS